MVTILNYGVGNVSSIHNMLRKIGVKSLITSDKEEIAQSHKIILPGVGNFDYCMQQLRATPFYDILQEKVLEDKTPILGVCVGCQMLFEKSEEGNEPGLGWIPGKVIRFQNNKLGNLKIPHMAWTDLKVISDNQLYSDIEDPRFYFVHSYHVETDCTDYVTATGHYGYDFIASVQKENILGVQFHPEKSHKFGMKLYSNFYNNF